MAKVNQNIIKALEEEQLKTDVPAFGAGDTVVVPVSYTHLRAHET